MNPTTEDSSETATCRYCRSQIHVEATKCRYCGSKTSGEEQDAWESRGRVVYVLDKDLIRFAKVAIAILGLFALVGLYLFGIDMKDLRSDMVAMRENLADANELLPELESAREEIGSATVRATNAAQLSEEILESILEDRDKVLKITSQLVQLRDGTLSSQTLTVISKSGADPNHGKMWPKLTTIDVAFLGGNATDRAKIEKWAREWNEGIGVQFRFVDDPGRAVVRVGMKKDQGSWSFIGTEAVNTPPGSATMNLGWIERRTVLHEFGHVLGLLHEHQNPANDIPWDKKEVYRELKGPPNFMSEKRVDESIFETYSADEYPIEKPFDRMSIMMYEFQSSFTVRDYDLSGGDDISPGDRAFVRALYPPGPSRVQ